MGGTMKGAQGHNNRRRWSNEYVVMAIVCCVFGCGILGLMGIHRFRERSSLNLLIKEKDDPILSLHLLLQKEREYVAETKRKTEEMKMEVTGLGSQKAELSSKMSEMQSTISSLREEQRAVESAFQEKQNEMREKYAQMSDQSPQVKALKEKLKQKQGEIEDLKLRLQLRAAEVGSNATMAEAKAEATESGGRKGVSTETEAIKDTSSENGGAANADRVKEDEAKSKKEDEEVMRAADDQEPEVKGSPRRFRGRYGYLRRAKGKRWILVGKQTQVRRSDGASTMADNGLRNSSEGKLHASLEEPAKSSETKTEVVHAQENEQLGDETTEDKNEHQHTDVLGRKGAAERNGQEQDDRDAEAREEKEEKEETDETEF